MEVRNLEPKSLWNSFADLNAVPRGSKKEERVIQFMIDFGKGLGLDTSTDAIGNVIIKKAASAGFEDRKTIILQSHLDMVHQKNAETNFDFDTQGIEMIVDGDWVKANGTTLGADNGIGVSTIMAILASDAIKHPAIEAMFTIDEETGMTGAKELDPSNFSGEILLNLDTEDDDELSIGCAGGIDTNTEWFYTPSEIPENTIGLELKVRGLMGGHSGMDIHKGRGNANKLLNRILHALSDVCQLQIVSFDGGSLRNAIPREASAVVAVTEGWESTYERIVSEISNEYKSIEANLDIALNETEAERIGASVEDSLRMIWTIEAVHNGVYRMSPDIEGLVEASSSLARVIIRDGKFETQSLQRSSVESSKTDVANTVKGPFELLGAGGVQEGDYPGWQPCLW